jgi:hypothetical protein
MLKSLPKYMFLVFDISVNLIIVAVFGVLGPKST